MTKIYLNLDGYLRSMNKGQGGRKNIQMTLDYTSYTNDTHLFHFSFFMGKKEIINWKPKNSFMLLFVSAISWFDGFGNISSSLCMYIPSYRRITTLVHLSKTNTQYKHRICDFIKDEK